MLTENVRDRRRIMKNDIRADDGVGDVEQCDGSFQIFQRNSKGRVRKDQMIRVVKQVYMDDSCETSLHG